MPKKPTLEILPTVVPQERGAKFKAMLAEMVREAIQVQREAEPEHSYQPSHITLEVERRQSMFERRFHSLYYERWGCIGCKTKTKIHASNMLCASCNSTLGSRKTKLKREWMKEHPDDTAGREVERITAKVRSAERLLGTGQGRAK